MTLWKIVGDGSPIPDGAIEPASPAELLAAARPHADYEAVAKEVGMIVQGILQGSQTPKHAGIDSVLAGHWAGRIVGAAFGGTDE